MAVGYYPDVYIDSDHWLHRVKRRLSPNANARPDPDDISLVVVHGISLPPGRFGTTYVDELFCNTLDCKLDPALADLDGVRVSAHVFITRRGRVTQYVPFDRRAWHAGVSSHRGRQDCNDFAVGVELEGTDESAYTNSQYRALIELLKALGGRYPRISWSAIVGHGEISPGRKTDPGPLFDWPRLYRAL